MCAIQGNGYHMDYNDELPTTTLNSVGNAVLQFIPSLLPGTLQFFSPSGDQQGQVRRPGGELFFLQILTNIFAGADELDVLGAVQRARHHGGAGAGDGAHQRQGAEGGPQHGARHQAL